jgi:ABC-type uncharacterized transport system permease subunit
MLLATFSVLAYLGSAISLLRLFFKHVKISLTKSILLGVLGLIIHAAFIATHFNLLDAHSYNLLLVSNLICILITGFALSFAKLSKNYFVMPVCFIFNSIIIIVSSLVPNNLETIASWSLELISHISLALIAYAILIISTLLAYQYNFISKKLKQHDLSVLTLPIPSLNTIEKQIFQLLFIGTATLALSILTGVVFLENFLGSGQSHKAILSIFALVCFTTLLIGHAKFGWRGHITLTLTITGSVFLTLGYFGSRFIQDFILH